MTSLIRTSMLAVLLGAVACGGSSSDPAAPAGTPDAAAGAVAAPASSELFGAPEPSAEQRNKLFDLGRDLQALAAGQAGAFDDLVSDLQGLTDPAPDPGTARALAEAARQALAGTQPGDAAATRVATVFYALLSRPDRPADTKASLGAELARAFADAGAPPGAASTAADAAIAAR
ncbi:MAG: hypothetical protein AB7O67_04450 [Vicinamibacterales bacterium]